jgi:hypothetical protein
MHTVIIQAPHDPVERVTPRLLVGPGDEGCAHMAAVGIEVPAGGWASTPMGIPKRC